MGRKEDPHFEISFFESVLKRSPGYSDVIEILGGLYTKTGRIADGLRMDRRLVKLQPENPTAHYNLACSLALSKRSNAALQSLRRAIDLGYKDYDWMSQDPDLEGLQKSKDFQLLLKKLQPKS